jgi:hypothetical protein
MTITSFQSPIRAALVPWAGLLGISTTLAWAMTVALTSGAHGPDGLPPSQQPLLLAGDAPRAVVVDTLFGDDALTPSKFRAASKVLTITVEGPGGSYDVRCVTTAERAAVNAAHVRPDQLMDLFDQLCSPQPSSS